MRGLRSRSEDLLLPKQSRDTLTEGVPLKVWNLVDGGDLKIAFKSIPPPGEVEAWKTYRVQILGQGEEGPTVLWESPNYAKAKRAARVTRTLKAADVQGHLKEGVYILRVEAFGADGAVLTAEPSVESKERGLRPENESEQFLVAEGDVVIDQPKEPRAVFADSLLDAWFDLRGTALLASVKRREPVPDRDGMTGQWDSAENSRRRDDVRFEVTAEGAQGRTVRVPGLLRALEYVALDQADHLGGWSVDFRSTTTPEDTQIVKETTKIPVGLSLSHFMNCRRRLFEAMQQQHRARNPQAEVGKTAGAVEVCDLLALDVEIRGYANAWMQAVQEILKKEPSVERSDSLAILAGMDQVHIRWPKSSADAGKGLLVLPLHPLRLLWHLQHARVRHDALQAM
jgi:hypothetical protein